MKKIFRRCVFFFAIIITSTNNVFSQCPDLIDHWEACVLDNHTWKYTIPSANIPNWQSPLFNDAAWNSGNGGMGFGDADDLTIIPMASWSVYMRRSFNITDTSLIKKVVFCMDFDDGFIVYLNGVELTHVNLESNPNFNQNAYPEHEATLYQGLQPRYYILSSLQKSLLKNGTNVLSVETHKSASPNDNDMTSRPFLMLGLGTPAVNYSPVPAWFIPPVHLYSNLPIVNINTLGQVMMDDPRIICDMGIVDNGPGNMNCQNGPFNNYNGKISIEYRGSTSQTYAEKKQYGFSTVDNIGNNLNVSLLGFPAEHDFVLLSMAFDYTHLYDVLSHEMTRSFNWYSSRASYVELVLNGAPQGLYVLLEKIKVDKNRVDIEKITPAMNSGDELTGGYIFKIDKTTGNAGNWWNTIHNINIQNHDPNWQQVTPTQKTYLTDYINNFETALWSPAMADPETGYRKMTNVYSFVDYYILHQLSQNADAFASSTFFYKDRDSKCGRLTIGPLWDVDFAYLFCQYWGFFTRGWMTKMVGDPWFKNLVNCRWHELRQNQLSTAHLHARIDTIADYIKQVAIRDSIVWQPNDMDYSLQLYTDTFKVWLANRLNFMDVNIFPATQPCNAVNSMNLVIDEINFHSDSTTNAGDWLELYNYGATTLDLSHAVILDGDKYQNYCVIPANTMLPAGGRLVVYADSLAFTGQFPLVTNKVGPLCFKLSNAGQKIVIRDVDNKLIYSVDYMDTWQCATDGNGRTLQLTNPAANQNLTSSWYAGCMGGSPGVAYTPCSENLIYSEINYNSSVADDAGDWIELHNKTNTAFSLTGWSIRDGSSNNMYAFPAGTTIPPTSYIVAYTDATKFTSKFPTVANKVGPLGFGFSSTGDVARVFDNTGKLRFSFCYGTSNPWPVTPNAGGYTLENGQYSGNQNASTTWFAGCYKGSPGYAFDPNCTPVATDEIIKEEYISIYPNPAKTELNIESSLKLDEVIIFDNTGRMVLKALLTNNKHIDISNLQNGIYHLQCKNNGNVYNVKFVKAE